LKNKNILLIEKTSSKGGDQEGRNSQNLADFYRLKKRALVQHS